MTNKEDSVCHKKRIIGGGVLFLWICLLTVQLWLNHQVKSFDMAGQWSADGEYHHVSSYFSAHSQITTSSIEQIRMQMTKTLKQNRIIADESESHIWGDAYSTSCTLTVSGSYETVQATAVGIGGDFFWFHPMKWSCGNAFLPDSAGKNIVLTKSCAWALFGAVDVTGLTVEIGENTYQIAGVAEDDADVFAVDAGADEYTVYMPYVLLQEENPEIVITQYEIVYPELVSGYAEKQLRQAAEHFAKDIVIVDQTNRNLPESRWEMILTLGQQVMQTDNVQFPAWENEARGWLLLLSVVTFIWTVSTLVLVIMIGRESIVKIQQWVRFIRKHWNCYSDKISGY